IHRLILTRVAGGGWSLSQLTQAKAGDTLDRSGAHLLLHKSFEPYLPLSGEMRACCSFSPMMKAFSEFHSNRSSHRSESKFLHYPKICVIGFLHVPWVQIQPLSRCYYLI
uniref:Uncharacterized protein n=1 Tax=Amphiprion percula TaxID=161767 RepID=A0A3P8TC05_AMPPE